MTRQRDTVFNRPEPVPHRRQFVVGAEPVVCGEGWQSVELGPSCVLSHCPALPVESVMDTDGVFWHLVGRAVQTDPDRPDPADEIGSTTTADVPGLYSSWASRWILIGDGELHMDASGMLGCYYLTDRGSSSRESPWISSSPALLPKLSPSRVGRKDPRKLVYRLGIEWFPPPRSQYAGMARLLPSQVLKLADGTVHLRDLIPEVDRTLPYDEILNRLETGLIAFVERISRKGRTVWLALTAGHDSRVLLATLCKAGIPSRTFTQEYRDLPVADIYKYSITTADQILPRKLAKAAGLDHVWVRRGRFDKGKAELFDAHTAGTCVDLPRSFFARDQWNFADSGDAILSAACFEVGRCGLWSKLGDSPIPNAGAVIRGLNENPDSSGAAAMAEWIDWVRQTSHDDLDWRDRYFIEQRLGGWRSVYEQALDLVPAEHFYPINSSRAFSLMQSVSVEKRVRAQQHIDVDGGSWFLDLTERMAPQLAGLPINPEYDYFPRSTRLYWRWHDDPFYPMRWIAQKRAELCSCKAKHVD